MKFNSLPAERIKMLKKYLILPTIILLTLTHSAIADPLDDTPDLGSHNLNDAYELTEERCDATYDESKLKINACSFKRNYVFNDAGNLIEEVSLFDNGAKIFIQYIYDSNNHAIGSNKYVNKTGDTNNFSDSTKIIRLNEKEKIYLEYDKDGMKTSSTKATFDSANNTLTKKSNTSNGLFPSIETYKYNKNDQLIEFDIKHTIVDKKFHDKVLYFYNKKGEVSEIKSIDMIKKTEKTEKYVYQYDDKGYWIQQISYNPEKLPDENATVIKRTIIYDKNKARKVKILSDTSAKPPIPNRQHKRQTDTERYFDLIGSVKSVHSVEKVTNGSEPYNIISNTKTTFNQKGQELEEIKYSLNNKIIAKMIKSYDKQGNYTGYKGYDRNLQLKAYATVTSLGENKTKIEHFDKKNTLVFQEIKTRDKSGNIVLIEIYRNDKMVRKQHNTFNKDNLILSEKHFRKLSTGEWLDSDTVDYYYNYNNVLIKTDTYEKEFAQYKNRQFEYEFDEQGNWIKRTEYDLDVTPKKAKIVTTREIKYYK